MLEILRRLPWSRRASGDPPVISEESYMARRSLIQAMGLGGVLSALPSIGCAQARGAGDERSATEYPRSDRWVPSAPPAGQAELYPARRNAEFAGGRLLTPEDDAATHNNFYEFLPGRAGPVHKYVSGFDLRPWEVKITGEVEEERTVDLDQIAKIAALEERIYRFRCVEAWSMVVPWTGLPLADFVRWCRPKPTAKYMKFTSFMRPEQAPGQKRTLKSYPWPYYEGLRLDEAMNPLSLLVTGVFGHGLPVQHGAPLRIIVPWKYGYKSTKSFVEVEFTSEQPGTFWSDLQPREYPFLSNVEPQVPHPRWSQAKERDIATGDRIPTQLYNGYEEYVAALYAASPKPGPR